MSAPNMHAAGGLPILGRADTSARLAALVDDDTPVAIVGEAGVGKTTLARAVLLATRRRVYEGGGFATLAWMPRFALERALGTSLSDADPPDMAIEVMRIVGDGVLFIDDLHWVDAASRAVVAHLAGRIGLVVGVRLGDPETDVVLAELPTAVVRLDLEPLHEAEAIELARRVRPGLAEHAARIVAHRAGGNPLLITELAAGGEDAVTLAAAVRVRLEALDAPARESMAMLALSGHPMLPAALGPGAGRIASAGLAILDARGRLRARHELLAAAAIDGLEPSERRRMHARLARLSHDPGEAARQHLAAGETRLAHRRALEAADAAATPGEQAAHLEVAAATADAPVARGMRLRAARALIDNRNPQRALEVLGDLAGDPDPVVAIVEAAAARSDYQLDRARASVARGIAAIDAGVAVTAETRVLLQLEAAQIEARAMGSPDGILAAARVAEALSRDHGIATVRAASVLGEARLLAGDLGGLDDLDEAVRAAIAVNDHSQSLAIGSRLVFGLLKAGRSGDGRALSERLARLATDARMGDWADLMQFWQAGFAWHTGDFEAAVQLSEGLAETGQDDAGWYGVQALADLGRLDEAAIRAERNLALAPAGEYGLGEALWLCADVAFWRGRWKEAMAYARRHDQEVPGAHQRIFVELPGAWAAVESGLAADWPARPAAMPIVQGGSIELEALRSMAEGRFGEAADRFDEAAAAWAGRHARGELRSRWAAGENLRRAGRTVDARSRLLELEPELIDVGHAPLLARTRRALRLVGVRRAAQRESVPNSPLTVREHEILRLSGAGLRDREIATRLGISRWAVVRSAESATAKLGTASRNEAVVATQAS